MEKKKTSFMDIIDKVEEFTLVAMFMAMVGVIFLQVIMRFVFNNSNTWSEELGKFFFVWISWLGISLGHRKREHIRITLLLDRFPYKVRMVMEAITELSLIVIAGITLYYSVMMMGVQKMVPYAGIKISTSWGYLSLVIGCGLFIIRAFMFFIEDVKSINKEEPIVEEGDL